MDSNQIYNENVPLNNKRRKWWKRRSIVISISILAIMIILGVSTALLLKFVILVPKKLENTTTTSIPMTSYTTTIPITTTVPITTTIITTTETSTPRHDWIDTGSMKYARSDHTASVLENGKVLVIGGMNLTAGETTCYNITELYDPATETWTATNSMNVWRDYYTQSILPNGKVLVTGGSSFDGIVDTTELYDVSTETWSFSGSMHYARQSQTASVLANGKVLVADGERSSTKTLASAELY